MKFPKIYLQRKFTRLQLRLVVIKFQMSLKRNLESNVSLFYFAYSLFPMLIMEKDYFRLV